MDFLFLIYVCRNLEGNKLTGVVPVKLLERSNNNLLKLRLVQYLWHMLNNSISLGSIEYTFS